MKALTVFLFATIISILPFKASAQTKYTLSKPVFEVEGTSTVHDWVMRSTEGTGTAYLKVVDGKITDISNLTISLPAESLRSSKGSMDDVAYNTLDTKTHKYIKYTLKSAQKVNEAVWVFTGIYNIAGVNKEFKTQVRISGHNGSYMLQGTNQVTFSDFEMSPPTAALGVIKTGKILTIQFNFALTDFAKNENVLVVK
jgi:hypothetical protein